MTATDPIQVAKILLDGINGLAKKFDGRDWPIAAEQTRYVCEAVLTLTAERNEARAERDKAVAAKDALLDVARDVYAESAGPDETAERHICHGCGVDLSMRGPEHEESEHSEGCHFGKLAAAIRKAQEAGKS